MEVDVNMNMIMMICFAWIMMTTVFYIEVLRGNYKKLSKEL